MNRAILVLVLVAALGAAAWWNFQKTAIREVDREALRQRIDQARDASANAFAAYKPNPDVRLNRLDAQDAAELLRSIGVVRKPSPSATPCASCCILPSPCGRRTSRSIPNIIRGRHRRMRTRSQASA